MTAVDHGNDGDLDLYVVNNQTIAPRNEANWFFRNLGDGTFAEVASASGVRDQEDLAENTVWFDVNGDRLLDVHMPTVDGIDRGDATPGHLLLGQPDGTYARVATSELSLDTRDIRFALPFDFDDDGDLDLFTEHLAGGPIIWRSDGGGHFTEVTAGSGVSYETRALSAAAGDYDNDGDQDLYLTMFDFGPNRLFRNESGVFTDVTAQAGVSGEFAGLFQTELYAGPVWADFENDGWLDLYMAGSTPSLVEVMPNLLYRNLGDGTFEEIGMAAGVAEPRDFQQSSTADFNRDGFVDLYTSGTGNGLYLNDGNANHWLAIDLVGTISNRSAIGARVWLAANGMTQMREITANTNHSSQSSLTAHIGLGSAEAVDSIRVRWPSGLVEDLTPPSQVDQYVTIVEGEGTVREDPNITRAGVVSR